MITSDVRGRQVTQQLDRQASALDELRATIEELESRIAPVALHKGEPDPSVSDHPQEVMAPIAGRLAGHTDAITAITYRVRAAISALEV